MQSNSLSDEGKRTQSSLNRSSHVVVLVVTVAAYLPALGNPDLSSYPASLLALLMCLGLLYLVLATLGNSYMHEVMPARFYLLYFCIQIPLTMAIFSLGMDVSSGIWLLILPIAAQSLILPRWQTALLNIGYLLLLTLMFQFQGSSAENTISFAFGIGAAMVFTLVFTNVAVREQEARQEVERLASELTAANAKLREYAMQVQELATTEERYRLAREIHDSLGHYLTAVNMQLSAAQAVLTKDPDKARIAIERAQTLSQEGLAGVRRSVAALRESPMGSRTLPEAIEQLISESRAAGLVSQLDIRGIVRELEPKSTLTLFRVAQEGLTNVRKHAHASRIDLLLDYTDPAVVSLTVADNGVGTAATSDETGFGLLGLQERAKLLGGEISYESEPGDGFALTARLPG